MQKNIFYTCLVSLLLSVAVGCAVKPYSKLLQVDGKNVNRILKLLPAKDGGSWCISDQGYGENAYFYISKLNAKSKIVWTKALEIRNTNFIDACATNDGNLVFAFKIDNKNTICKINKQGKLLWNSSFISLSLNKVIVLNAEEGIGISFSTDGGDNGWLMFAFIDGHTGEIKQVKSTWSENPIYTPNISILPDSTFVVTGQAFNARKSSSLGPTKNPTFYYILRIDKDANLIWKKEFENIFFSNAFMLQKDKIEFITNNVIAEIDNSGKLIEVKEYDHTFTQLVNNNPAIFVGNVKRNKKTNKWELPSIYQKYEPNYVTINKMNAKKEIKWTKGFLNGIAGVEYIVENNRGFLLAGNFSDFNTFLLQTDKLGNNPCFQDIDILNKKGIKVNINDDKRFEEVTEEIMKIKLINIPAAHWQLEVIPTKLKKFQKVNMKMISVCPQDLK